GLRGVANDTDEFRVKRFHGVPNYFILRSDASYSRSFPWGIDFGLRASGQFAVDTVISNEQFSIAGSDGVRGYLEAEQLGDVGIKASAEIGPRPWNLFGDHLTTRISAFFDYGRMSRLDPLRRQDPRTGRLLELLEEPNVTLRSVGASFGFSA